MPSSRSFLIAARLAQATTVILFALIVIGSVVRTTGSGLACPDWPLCHGRLIPPMQFNVLIEWFHRLVALLASLMLAATVGWIGVRPELRARLGGLSALAVALLVAQVLLGALTVWKLLDPSVVSGHLAVALLLFSTVVTIALVAHNESLDPADGPIARRPPGLLATFAVTTGLVYAQSVLGGMVSTNHASLVCPDWPTCRGEWFPAMTGLVGLQMSHRFAAYALTAVMVFAALRARQAPDAGVRAAAPVLLVLTLAQGVLGVSNVLLGTPVWLSALHLANATTMLAISLVVTFRVALLPQHAAGFVRAATA